MKTITLRLDVEALTLADACRNYASSVLGVCPVGRAFECPFDDCMDCACIMPEDWEALFDEAKEE